MYRVIYKFKDLQDNDHIYEVGDKFPRKGLVVDDARIAELAGSENKLGAPLIEEVKAVKVKKTSKPKAKKE